MFFPGLSEQTVIWSYLSPVFIKLQFFDTLYNLQQKKNLQLELRYSFKFNGTILHIWFKSKFDSKKLLTLLIGTLLLELTLFEPNESALEV